MKIIAFLLMLNVALITECGFAQFQVSSIEISLSNLIGQNTSFNDIDGMFSNPTDTTNFSISINENVYVTFDTLKFDGKLLHFSYEHIPDKYNELSSHKTIDITIEPNARVITELTLIYSDTSYADNTTEPFYSGMKEYLQCKDLPFFFSKSKDTISVFLKMTQLKTTNFSAYKFEDFESNVHFYGDTNSFPIGLSDSAFLIIKINGNGPLALAILNKPTPSSFVNVNITNKTIKIINLLKNRKQTTCFDILGRKHNLEFLGADNTSATYSVRSLLPGVYFVNDGRETVKFMIGE
jgi:hypothetical protein